MAEQGSRPTIQRIAVFSPKPVTFGIKHRNCPQHEHHPAPPSIESNFPKVVNFRKVVGWAVLAFSAIVRAAHADLGSHPRRQ